MNRPYGKAELRKRSQWEDGFPFVGDKVAVVGAGNLGRRYIMMWLSLRARDVFVLEDGFHSGGDVVQCELGRINLRSWVCAELFDHVMGEGVEEDGRMLGG